MQNAVDTLEALFTLRTFKIPQYQRAYAWEEDPHLEAFLGDLRQQSKAQETNPGKDYFLGTFLLHETGKRKVDVVDGQQRLTTSVIFIAAALQAHNERSVFQAGLINEATLRRDFIYDREADVQKLHTIAEDNPFFKSQILRMGGAEVTEESPSSLRLKAAFKFFCNHVADEEWECLVQTLINSKVMTYSVTNSADATLIFELQNDRGKPLTDLEALKSYLMHLVYLHAKNPDDNLGEIQAQFSKIYRTVEALDQIARAPDEDSLLGYHCAAYLDWNGDEWRRPKKLIRSTIHDTPDQSVTEWVLGFTSDLRESFKAVQTILSNRDQFPEFAELMLLDRMASFWPLVIKAYRYDLTAGKTNFRVSCRLMEVYAMRGYGISNLRSDAGFSSMYTHARNFSGDFNELHSFLHALCSWYGIPERFEAGLNSASLYHGNRKDAQYLLWRYENFLRTRRGRTVEPLSWRQYLIPHNNKSRLSLEHIASQGNPISETIVQWTDEEEPRKFVEVATHRLGNLVLDSISANSSKGKHDFSDKLESLSKHSTFLSQGELIDWALENSDGEKIWNADSIRRRQEHLIDFARRTWDPDTYYQLPDNSSPEEIDLIETM